MNKSMGMGMGMGFGFTMANKMNATLVYVRISWLPVYVCLCVRARLLTDYLKEE